VGLTFSGGSVVLGVIGVVCANLGCRVSVLVLLLCFGDGGWVLGVGGRVGFGGWVFGCGVRLVWCVWLVGLVLVGFWGGVVRWRLGQGVFVGGVGGGGWCGGVVGGVLGLGGCWLLAGGGVERPDAGPLVSVGECSGVIVCYGARRGGMVSCGVSLGDGFGGKGGHGRLDASVLAYLVASGRRG